MENEIDNKTTNELVEFMDLTRQSIQCNTEQINTLANVVEKLTTIVGELMIKVENLKKD